eukprot:2771630-Pyramimonas_sp.AAC.1
MRLALLGQPGLLRYPPPHGWRCLSVTGESAGAAPGPGGLRYAAWNAGLGPRILIAALRWISMGHLMDSAFSALLAVFLPKPLKGSQVEPDEGGVFRKASETRPMGFKSTSNK